MAQLVPGKLAVPVEGAQTLVDLVQLVALVVTVGLGPALQSSHGLCKGSNVEMHGKL